MMPRQLPLLLSLPPALGRGDFLVAPANAAVLEALDQPQGWPGGRMLLIGPEGAGKSHLSAFWAQERGAACLPAAALRPDVVDEALPAGAALVIEDADQAGGVPAAEQALFHLWNLAPARGASLLLTARTPPRDWGVLLPDLRSRMDAVSQLHLGCPDEGLLAAVLVKLFADRQLTVAPDVIEALVLRMDRDLGLARRLVGEIDAAALSAGRKITRRLALDSLAALTGEAEAEEPPEMPELAGMADLTGP